MKHNIFSKGIYKESLRRLRVVGFLWLAFLLILQAAPVIIQVTDYSYFLSNPTEYLYYYDTNEFPVMSVTFETVLMSFYPMVTIAAPLMVLSLFSVFNKRSSSDFYHSLPYTRTCIFVSKMAAIYTWVLGICAVCSILGFLSFICLPNLFVLSYGGFFDLLLSFIAILLLTTGGCSLAMAITGTPFSNFCVAGIILFLPRTIITIIGNYIAARAEFLVFNSDSSSFLSPSINVLFAGLGGSVYGTSLTNNLTADIYSILLGAAYLTLALLAFKKRKSETASQPSPGRIWQHAIRILVASLFAMFPVILFVGEFYSAAIIMGLLTVVIYFAYEIITTKKWKNCLKAAPGLLAVAGFCVICVLTIIFVPKIAATYTPDADDVDSVRLVPSDGDYYANFYYYDEWYSKKSSKIDIKDEKVLEIICSALKSNMESYEFQGDIYSYYDDGMLAGYNESTIYQTVAIRDGLTVRYRNIAFTQKQYDSLLTALESNREYIKACQTMPKPAKGSIRFSFDESLSTEDTEMLFSCLQKEIYELSLSEWYSVINNQNYMETIPEIYYYTDDLSASYVSFYVDSENFPVTYKMMMDFSEKNKEKHIEAIDKILAETSEHEERKMLYADLSCCVKITSEDGSSQYYYRNSYYNDNRIQWLTFPETKAIITTYELAKDSDNEPSESSYIQISYSYDSNKEEVYESVYGTVFLPLPDDFDPLEYGFEEISYQECYLDY